MDAEIVIVGGGVFGLSTALSLATGSYKDKPHRILVIDRDPNCPSQDAASSDYNKICRNDYSDPAYSELALDAMKEWSSNPLYRPYFHQSGLVVTSSAFGSLGETYVRRSFEYCARLHDSGQASRRPRMLTSTEEYRAALQATPSKIGPMPSVAYINELSGWAWSRGAIDAVARKCRDAGVTFVTGEVNSLIFEDNDVRGARTSDGKVYKSSKLVVLAAGSWSAAISPDLEGDVVASGQVLATMQLDSTEQADYAKIPVIIDMHTGFYVFPPNADGVLKFALHHRGYVNKQPSLSDETVKVSTPLTHHFGKERMDNIPKAAVLKLRQELGKFWPALARKPFAGTRMCWYSDSQDTHFLISYHKKYKSLFLATGDSGHAFKFLPIIGGLCVQAIEHKLPAALSEAWSHARERQDYKPDRGDSVLLTLDVNDPATEVDLAGSSV